MKIKKLLIIGIGSLITFSSESFGSGFQLFEQNAVNMGDFSAGGAAIAQDASTSYYNPAGLTRIHHHQFMASVDGIVTNQRFTGTNTWTSPLLPGFAYQQTVDGLQGGKSSCIPAIAYASPLFCNRLAFGLSIGAPFGLETDYDPDSVLRYSATYSQLQTIDISPSIGLKLNRHLSIGAGFDPVYFNTTLNSVAGLPIIPTNRTLFDTASKNEATGWGYGWHAGVLYEFTPATRVGLAYHSQISSNLSGKSRLIGPLAGTSLLPPQFTEVETTATTADITLPPFTTLSAYHDINCQWAVDGSVVYTQWDRFNKNVVLHNVQGTIINPLTGGLTPQLIDVTIPQNFHNTWRFALGAIYHPIPMLALRAGVGYDQTPTDDTDRSVRLPDGDRYAIAVGAHYQPFKQMGLDVGWTHLFIRNAHVGSSVVTGQQISTATGDYKSSADLFGAQVTFDMVC